MATNQMLVCESANAVGLERTRFFPRQLIAPEDLTQDQLYFREKLRRHNRLLHGWGVVCGCKVKRVVDKAGKPKAWSVVIEPGYVLDLFGNEIPINQEVTLDIRREGLDGYGVGPCSDQLDPWCSEVEVERPAGVPLYVAVRYAECQSRPVRVHPAGCGCDETECEYSRIRDSYAIKVLTRLPSTYSDPMPQPKFEESYSCAPAWNEMGRPCPPCPPEPWVILADVTVGANGEIDKIDCLAHRRYVVSFADYYFLCNPQAESPKLFGLKLEPETVVVGVDSQGTVTLSGPAPAGGAVVNLSSLNTAVATVPGTVTVPAGQTNVTFQVTTKADGKADITASFGGVTLTATLTVQASVVLISVRLTPNPVRGGKSSTGRVTLSGPAPAGGAVVNLSSLNTAVATVPGTVTVPAGQTNEDFTVKTRKVRRITAVVVVITATYGGTERTAKLAVNP